MHVFYHLTDPFPKDFINKEICSIKIEDEKKYDQQTGSLKRRWNLMILSAYDDFAIIENNFRPSIFGV